MASTPMNPQTRRPAELESIVAMLQIEFSGIGNHGVAEAAGAACKGVFLAPHPVDFIETSGADGRIRFAPDIL